LSQDQLAATLTEATKVSRTSTKSDHDDYKGKTRLELSKSAERLRTNIKSISEVLFLFEGKGGQTSSSDSAARSRAPRSFSLAFLIGGTFRDLQEYKICRSIFRQANFTAGNLTRAVILDSDFSNANFSHANLSQCKCSGTKFVGAVFREADLSGAKFQNVDLSGADLAGAKFRNTVVPPAAFEHTEWWKADFRNQRDLLKAIHAKYKKDLPDLEGLYVRGEIHRSVLDLIGKITEERL
jgi:uncharacterized protein YjbI with pentapeptide repeats